ncbi:MAG: nitrous oxide reductase family maturation protein NosD [Anaerolineae bacterium]
MGTMRTTGLKIVLLAMLVCLAWHSTLSAQDGSKRLVVGADGGFETIEAALEVATNGDVIEVHGGVYAAPLVIEKSVSFVGVGEPVIDGQGTGSLVLINASDTQLDGFSLRNSGMNLNHEDTAIVIQAPRVKISHNTIENVLFGIYFANANEGVADGNVVRCADRELGLRGDAIRVWYSNNVVLRNNHISDCRDTLIWYAEHITVTNNVLSNGRYGLHFMYSSEADVENNRVEGNSVGTYLMYSQHLTMTSNQMLWNRGPSGYGIALKEMDYVTLQDNLLIGNRAGLYIDDSPALVDINNYVLGNFIGYNDIGIAALPSTKRNIFQSNTFLENNQQVSLLGRGNLLGNTWQYEGIGNYWSDYVGYDGNHDGVGDMPYRAEKLFENLMDSEPALRLFSFSPASQAVDFAASAFPSLRPDPKVIDDAPQMSYTIPASIAAPPATVSVTLLAATLILIGIGSSVCMIGLRGRTAPRVAKKPVPEPN